MEDELGLQSRATERYQYQNFEEIKELEEKKSEEALAVVQKRHELWEISEWKRRSNKAAEFWEVKKGEKGDGLATSLLFCRSSTVDHDEEMTLKSPRKRQEVQEVMKETEWKEARRREEEEAWRLEPEGETEMQETGVVADGVEGIYVDLNGEGHQERGQVKITEVKVTCQEKNAKKWKSLKRKIIWGATISAAKKKNLSFWQVASVVIRKVRNHTRPVYARNATTIL